MTQLPRNTVDYIRVNAIAGARLGCTMSEIAGVTKAKENTGDRHI